MNRKNLSAQNKNHKKLLSFLNIKKISKIFKEFTNSPYAITVSSCTAGMHLVYFTIGLGPGDEVIVPAQTHIATAHAVELTGAKPVFVDAEIESLMPAPDHPIKL